jgi:hypothetical protein
MDSDMDDDEGDEARDGVGNLDPEAWNALKNLSIGSKHDGRKSSLAVLVDFMGQTRRDVERLKTEKSEMKTKIVEWNKEFKRVNGREATKAEKESGASDLYTRYQKVLPLLPSLPPSSPSLLSSDCHRIEKKRKQIKEI